MLVPLTIAAKRPDGDNLDKFLFDALTGVVWRDDSQVAWLLRSKSYTREEEGATILFVKEMAPGAPNYDEILATMREATVYEHDLLKAYEAKKDHSMLVLRDAETPISGSQCKAALHLDA